MHVTTRYINSIRGTSSDWALRLYIYLEFMYLVFTCMPGESLTDWECTCGGVYVPCIYTHARWVTVGDSGLCCVCVRYFKSWLTPLCVDSARHSGPRSVSDSSLDSFKQQLAVSRLFVKNTNSLEMDRISTKVTIHNVISDFLKLLLNFISWDYIP